MRTTPAGDLPSPDAAMAIAERLVAARRNRCSMAAYPGRAPESLAQAYAIQDAAIGMVSDAVAGWKVGGVPASLQPLLGAARVAGPVFSRNVWLANSGEKLRLPAIVGGFAAVEAEFVARIGSDIDPRKTHWTLDEAAAVIDRVFVGIELAGSPLPIINDLGPTVSASDFGANAGLVLGPEVKDWRDDLDRIEVSAIINGDCVGAGTAGSLNGGVVASVRFLLEHCASRDRPLNAGALISTGALTGVHRVSPGDDITCVFAGVARIDGEIVRAEHVA